MNKTRCLNASLVILTYLLYVKQAEIRNIKRNSACENKMYKKRIWPKPSRGIVGRCANCGNSRLDRSIFQHMLLSHRLSQCFAVQLNFMTCEGGHADVSQDRSVPSQDQCAPGPKCPRTKVSHPRTNLSQDQSVPGPKCPRTNMSHFKHMHGQERREVAQLAKI